ncbi:hypothetical protein NT6N_25340 [Oceaniferula spumae]|uniref:DUF2262 domain-containing protein n=1 Tax=Oceaniferula spumae TaxID=2979115 RepID=A0AAT9FNB3_9BACT
MKMHWLKRFLRIQTDEERLLTAIGIDPAFRDKSWQADGITYKRISISEVEGSFRHSTILFPTQEFEILISAADRTTQQHLDLIRHIRANFDTLLQASVDSIIKISDSSDLDEFKLMAHDPSIMLGEDGEEFDGESWSLVVEWGKGDFGYHCEFKSLDLIDTWGGD